LNPSDASLQVTTAVVPIHKHHSIKTERGVEVKLKPFITSALDGDK